MMLVSLTMNGETVFYDVPDMDEKQVTRKISDMMERLGLQPKWVS